MVVKLAFWLIAKSYLWNCKLTQDALTQKSSKNWMLKKNNQMFFSLILYIMCLQEMVFKVLAGMDVTFMYQIFVRNAHNNPCGTEELINHENFDTTRWAGRIFSLITTVLRLQSFQSFQNGKMNFFSIICYCFYLFEGPSRTSKLSRNLRCRISATPNSRKLCVFFEWQKVMNRQPLENDFSQNFKF